jgi:hypothetical protein
MKKVTGIGGVFFKTKDAKAIKYEYEKFGWVMDPEGNKIELWKPTGTGFTKMYEGKTIH